MEMFVFRKRSGVMREETGGDYPDTLYVNVCVCVLCRYVNKPKLAHFGNQLRQCYTIFMPFSSGGHNSFLLPPMNLIYGSKDSSLQELYNEL